MNLIKYPQDAMHFHCMLSCERAKLTVAGQQDTAGMTLRECKGKSVVNRELWSFRDSSLNSTIPEPPGSGWLAAESEATPQTHRLRPWGFPTVSPSHPSVFPHHGIQRIMVEFSEEVSSFPAAIPAQRRTLSPGRSTTLSPP